MFKRTSFILGYCLLVISASGCRFGNYAEPTQSQYRSIDLYFTQARTFETAVTYTNNTGNQNNNAPLISIPSNIRNTFTNPVYFIVPKDLTQSPMFVGMNQTNYLSTTIKDDGTIGEGYSTLPTQFWSSPDCQTWISVAQAGSFDDTHGGTVTFGDGSKSPVKGSLSLDFYYSRELAGDCAGDLQRLATCYANGAGCDTDELNAASTLFDTWVRTGILNMTDATRIKKLEYLVHFE
ncbi:MAG: hypothetical protein JST80_10800 [Bdellovibrionales bacterium]|nr:hypothetical protein [Bdellovibrionales bacterium]